MAAVERRIDQLFDGAQEPGKRKRQRRDSVAEDDASEIGVPRSKPQKRVKHEPGSNSRRFACPFCKHEPAKYKNVKTCCGPGWLDVHRVKEHLYRRHCLKSACPRCFEFFEDDKALKEHQRAEKSCKLKTKAPTNVISEDQEKLLRARAKPNSPSDEKWRDMYKILFPGDKIPTPYYDGTEEEAFAKAEQQSRFKDLDECKAFFKAEIKRIVKPILEEEVESIFQAAQETMVKKANTLITDISNKLIRTWRFQSEQSALIEPSPTSSPSPARSATPEPKQPDVFEALLDNVGEDPFYNYIFPGGEFDFNEFIPEQPVIDLGFDCGNSVMAPDSGYFSSSVGGYSWDANSSST